MDWNNSNILPLLHFNLWFIPIIYKLKKQIGIMAGPFKMKNSGLKMSAKSGSPMQANYASPVKDDVYGVKKKYAAEEQARKSKLPLVENIAGGRKSYDEITNAANKEYMQKGSKSFDEIAAKAEKKLNKAKSFNKSRQAYLNYAEKVNKGGSKLKGTLRATPSLATKLKNKVKNLFN